jgi:hypothetical protein
MENSSLDDGTILGTA